MDVRDEFSAEVLSAIDESSDLGYYPTAFINMIRTRHPVEVAKFFVNSGEEQSGLQKLKQLGRPDLTVEGIMIKPKYAELFTNDELQAATWRLNR
ncbi:TPA: hypothetical protein NKY23_000003 [Vibrio parahaemolyticus]|nr:hypothetical protein [Vibrio parahaemolyticus]